MRVQVIIASLLLILVGTAMPVSAESECTPPSETGVKKACGKVYVVDNTVSCIWGGYWEETGAGPVVFRQYRCSGYNQS